jgi:hypothetical protein
MTFATRMRVCLAALALALALGPDGAEAVFRVEKANFKVNMPSSIKGQYDMAIANFGTPLYGAILA